MSLRTKVIKYPNTSPLVRIITVYSRTLQALLCYLYSVLSRRPIAAYPSNWLLVYVQCTIHAHPLQNSLPRLFFHPFSHAYRRHSAIRQYFRVIAPLFHATLHTLPSSQIPTLSS